jgi:hypothetical protein
MILITGKLSSWHWCSPLHHICLIVPQRELSDDGGVFQVGRKSGSFEFKILKFHGRPTVMVKK